MNYYPYSIPVLMYARLLQNQQALAAYTGSICAFKEIMWRATAPFLTTLHEFLLQGLRDGLQKWGCCVCWVLRNIDRSVMTLSGG